MDANAKAAELVQILGGRVSRQDALRLLEGCDGDLNLAAAAHFAAPSAPQGDGAGSSSGGVAQLRAVLGPNVLQRTLVALLRSAGQVVERAAELWFSGDFVPPPEDEAPVAEAPPREGGAAGSGGNARHQSRGGGNSNAARNRTRRSLEAAMDAEALLASPRSRRRTSALRPDDYVVISSSSSSSEDEDDGEAQPPVVPMPRPRRLPARPPRGGRGGAIRGRSGRGQRPTAPEARAQSPSSSSSSSSGDDASSGGNSDGSTDSDSDGDVVDVPSGADADFYGLDRRTTEENTVSTGEIFWGLRPAVLEALLRGETTTQTAAARTMFSEKLRRHAFYHAELCSYTHVPLTADVLLGARHRQAAAGQALPAAARQQLPLPLLRNRHGQLRCDDPDQAPHEPVPFGSAKRGSVPSSEAAARNNPATRSFVLGTLLAPFCGELTHGPLLEALAAQLKAGDLELGDGKPACWLAHGAMWVPNAELNRLRPLYAVRLCCDDLDAAGAAVSQAARAAPHLRDGRAPACVMATAMADVAAPLAASIDHLVKEKAMRVTFELVRLTASSGKSSAAAAPASAAQALLSPSSWTPLTDAYPADACLLHLAPPKHNTIEEFAWDEAKVSAKHPVFYLPRVPPEVAARSATGANGSAAATAAAAAEAAATVAAAAAAADVKGKGKARAGAAAAAAAAKGRAPPPSSPSSSPLPHYAVRIVFHSTPTLFAALGASDLQSGDLALALESAERRKWSSKTSAALGIVVATLLAQGSGLSLGPDCDGLLNLCDEEWEAAEAQKVAATAAAVATDSRNKRSTAAGGDEARPSSSLAAAATTAAAGLSAPSGRRGKSAAATSSSSSSSSLCDLLASRPPFKAFDLQRLVNSCSSVSAGLPHAAKPAAIQSEPKPYQLQGLEWMTRRERLGDASGTGLVHLHPCWLQLVAPGGEVFYLHRFDWHLLSTTFYPAPQSGTCGGFLCDQMGLGKTLQTLMLVAAHRPPPGWAHPEDQPLEVRDGEGGGLPIKTTLVVAPANLIPQWVDEIETHVASGALTYCVYGPRPKETAAGRARRGAGSREASAAPPSDADDLAAPLMTRRAARRQGGGGGGGGAAGAPSSSSAKQQQSQSQARARALLPVTCSGAGGEPVDLHKHDICLVSYEHLRRELSNVSMMSPAYTLTKLGFWRVVLDEAQNVANSSSAAAAVCSSLWRRHAWVVTGTPISSKLEEVLGLLQFLSDEPYSDRGVWRELLEEPYKERTWGGLLAMRCLLRRVLLRRTQADCGDQLQLPPCMHDDVPAVLSTAERAFYETLQKKYVKLLESFKANRYDETHRGGPPATAATARLMSGLTALRQACCHPQIARSAEAQVFGEAATKHGRLSMKQIMARLVLKAYSEFDVAAGAWFATRVLQAGLADYDGMSGGDELMLLLAELQAVGELVSGHDVRLQAVQRKADGTIELAPPAAAAAAAALDKGKRPANAAGAGGSGDPRATATDPEASLAAAQQGMLDPLATLEAAALKELQDAARERRRRWRKLELDALHLLHHVLRTCLPDAAGGVNAVQGALLDDMDIDEEEAGMYADVPSGGSRDGSDDEEGGGLDGRARARAAALRRAKLAKAKRKQADKAAALRVVTDARQVKAVTARLEGVTERIMALRSELGLGAAVLDGTAAQVRRSKRKWEQRQKRKAAEAAGGPSGSGPTAAAGGSKKRGRGDASDSKEDGGGESSGKEEDEADEGVAAPGSGGGSSNGNKRVRFEQGTGSGSAAASLGAAAGSSAAAAAAAAPAAAVEMPLLFAVVNEEVVRKFSHLLVMRDPAASLETAAKRGKEEMSSKWHALSHVLHKERDTLAAMAAAPPPPPPAPPALRSPPRHGAKAGSGGAAGGSAAAAPAAAAAAPAAAAASDALSCPICLDIPSQRTITSCGHAFCSDCIGEIVHGGHGAPCPICRTPLRPADLFEPVPEEEAAAEQGIDLMGAEFGTKVSCLLASLSDLQARQPGSKSVVFSSWGRLLRLVGDALAASGVEHASLVGGGPAQRQAQLQSFLHDPSCRVLLLLMSNSSGAAGLTLTVASHAFILEPSLNPGLEAQAAARIHRLGQTRPARVVRFIAPDTVEQRVLALQEHKRAHGQVLPPTAGAGQQGGGAVQEVDSGVILQYFDVTRPLQQSKK